MDFSTFLIYTILLTYVGGTIYLANLIDIPQITRTTSNSYGLPEIAAQQRTTILRWMLYGLIAMNMVFALFILQIGVLQDATASLQEFDVEMPVVDPAAAVVSFVISLVLAVFAFRVVTSDTMRQTVKRWISGSGSYNPESSVHTVAIVLSVLVVSFTIGFVVISGGISGLAEEEASNLALNELLFQEVLLVVAAFLGVGLALRRTWQQSLERLGLRLPTMGDVLWGVGVGVLLYGLLMVMVFIWQQFVPLEQIQEQNAAAEQLAQAFNTIPLAFLLSLSAAVGEEILFRGALQPIFGLIPTSIVFVLFHSQYTFTPATLIIFVVALGLGLLRQRQSTTASIIAHFTYNFIQLALAILAAQYLGGSI